METMLHINDIPRKRQSAVVLGMAMQRMQQGLYTPERLKTIVSGLQQYEIAPRTNDLVKADTIQSFGNSRLLSYRSGASGLPIFITPSIINSARVFDLTKERSFIRYLLEDTDSPVYLLDWGDLGTDKDASSLEKLIIERLLPALETVQQKYKTPPALLGYCLGGLLTTAVVNLASHLASALIYLATPWNFNDRDDNTAKRARIYRQSILPTLKTADIMPSSSLYSFFAHLPGSHTPEKFEGFEMLLPNSPERDIFIAVEDWAQEGTDIPSQLLDEMLSSFYELNEPHNNAWHIAGKLVTPQQITLPSLHITPLKDRIISCGSAQALHTIIGGEKDLLSPPCGHVGIMAGHAARTHTWHEIGAFLVRCKTAAPLP